jgi:NADPH:quinone reductase-like Zn-dependent oxidoreductase
MTALTFARAATLSPSAERLARGPLEMLIAKVVLAFRRNQSESTLKALSDEQLVDCGLEHVGLLSASRQTAAARRRLELPAGLRDELR